MNKYVYEYAFTRRRIAENPGQLTTPNQAWRFLQPIFEGTESEKLVVVALDRKQRPLGFETTYLGHVAGTSVRIGELFRFAVRVNACGVILAHNHPSGDPTPSGDDIRTTRDAVAAGRLLGIPVIDHVVICEEKWASLKEQGLV